MSGARPRIVTCVVLVALTGVNTVGMRLGAGIAVVLTFLKVLALAAIVGLGVALMKGSAANFASVAAPKPLLDALAPVLASILWTYDGWSDVTSVAGEVREPQRTLPRILLTGTAVTAAVYIAVNAVYIAVVPLAEMRALPSVAPAVMDRLVGPAGASIVTAMIVLSTFGATHGSIITGARITFAQARDGLLFRFLGRIHPKHETPALSLWVQLVFSSAAVLFVQTFDKLAG